MSPSHVIRNFKEALFQVKLAIIASFNRKVGRTRNSNFISLLLWFLELKFQKSPIPLPLNLSQVNKILIFRGDQIGDMIVFTSALNVLKQYLPKVSIHIWASPSNAVILKNNGNVEKVYTVTLSSNSIKNHINLCQKEGYDMLLDLSFWEHYLTASIAKAINPKAISVVLDNKNGKRAPFLQKMYNTVLLPKGLNWAEEYHLAMLGLLGVHEPSAVKTSIPISHIENDAVLNFLATKQINSGFLILNLSAREACKKWGAKNSIQFLFRYFQESYSKHPLPIVITAAPIDSNDVQEIQKSISNPNLFYYPSTPNFLEIVALVQRSIGGLSPDTAFVHACASEEKPILVLCTPKSTTNAWLPFTEKKTVLWSSHNQDTSTITVETVFKAFIEFRDKFLLKDN